MRQSRGIQNKKAWQGNSQCGSLIAIALMMFIAGLSNPVLAEPLTEERISGVGYEASPGKAKQMALSQIVYKINQKISYNRCQRTIAETQRVNCTSLAYYFDFPLEGIRYAPIPTELGTFGSRATLTREAVVSQFKGQLPHLKQKIVAGLSRNEHSFNSLQSIWQARDALTAYSEILTLFGIKTDISLDDKQTQELAELEMASAKTLASLDQLSDYVLELGAVQNAFIHAPVPDASVEMTPFSELVRRTLSQDLSARFPQADIKLRGTPSRGLVRVRPCYDPIRRVEKKCASGSELNSLEESPGAETLLLGKYAQKADSILLQYKLLNTETGKARTIFLEIPDTLLEGIRATPIHRAFDQELHQNILGDDQFHVQLGSSRGNRNILIYEKEDISLKLRASQSAYFYIVGHVIRKDKQYSYLVELDPRNGTFVSRIGEEQVNRWVEIGEFTIEPPLGVEHLQLIAANYDLSGNLPPTRWDEALGYHVIQGSENDALAGLQAVRGLQRVCSNATTRGLQRNCSSEAKIETDREVSTGNESAIYEHESVLSYTSLPLSLHPVSDH